MEMSGAHRGLEGAYHSATPAIADHDILVPLKKLSALMLFKNARKS